MGFIETNATGLQITSLDDVQTGFLPESVDLPLAIQPQQGAPELADWVETNRKAVDEALSEFGGLLFRGFSVTPDSGFKRFADAVGSGSLEYTQRSTKRTKQGEGIYTSTEYPAALSIDQHSENAFQFEWPQRLMFHSVIPAQTQGSTPLADNARVYDSIDPAIRAEFEARDIRYVRNFGGGLELSWQEAFQTEDQSGVETYLQSHRIAWEWKDRDRLKTEETLPAVIHLPALDRNVWFNQAHLFHGSNLDPGIRGALLEALSEDDLPRNALFGDGGTIPDQYFANIREAYQQNLKRFLWQKDDVMLIDNLRTCHGRDPFTGPRKVLVSMCDPADFEQFAPTNSAWAQSR